MSRSAISAGFLTLASALGIPSMCVLVKFNTLGVNLVNTGKDVTLGSVTYTGVGVAGIRIEGAGENLLGEAPSAVLTLVDLGASYFDEVLDDDFRGDTVTITLGYFSSGSVVSTGWETTYAVDTDGFSEDEIRLRLASADAVEGTEVPRRTTQEAGCQHDFKKGLCSYRGSLTTCDKSYSGPNGCKAHFPAYTSSGETIVPARPYGGFPGGFPHSLVTRG